MHIVNVLHAKNETDEQLQAIANYCDPQLHIHTLYTFCGLLIP